MRGDDNGEIIGVLTALECDSIVPICISTGRRWQGLSILGRCSPTCLAASFLHIWPEKHLLLIRTYCTLYLPYVTQFHKHRHTMRRTPLIGNMRAWGLGHWQMCWRQSSTFFGSLTVILQDQSVFFHSTTLFLGNQIMSQNVCHTIASLLCFLATCFYLLHTCPYIFLRNNFQTKCLP